ncbi:Eukaryotic porin [Gracilaria domingensis]|nr:Eukaryotic porin [Gracilaria domingensis]
MAAPPSKRQMKQYSDIGKIAKKLLTDDYIYANKLKLTSKTPDGVSYTITGVQSSKSDDVAAEISAKCKIKGATFTAKAFTGGRLPTLEAKYESCDAQGRKATLTTLAGKQLRVGTAEFLGGPVGVKLVADAITQDMYASLAVALTSDKYDGFIIAGAEGEYNVSKRQFGKSNYAVSLFDGKESEVSLHVADNMQTTMLSYSHHVRHGFSAAAQISHSFNADSTRIAMGAAYRLDGATTIKGKLDMDGCVALTYLQDIRPNAKLIMSSKFDPTKLDNAKVGVSLAIE